MCLLVCIGIEYSKNPIICTVGTFYETCLLKKGKCGRDFSVYILLEKKFTRKNVNSNIYKRGMLNRNLGVVYAEVICIMYDNRCPKCTLDIRHKPQAFTT